MEMNSMEKEIREKLQDRSLTPSRDAWNKLEAKLPAVPARKNNFTRFYWIAAAIAVIVLLGSVFFSLSGRFPAENELPVVDGTIKNAPIEKPEVKAEKENDPLSEDQHRTKNTPVPFKKQNASKSAVAEAAASPEVKKTPVQVMQKKEMVATANVEEQVAQKTTENTEMQAEVEKVLKQIEAIHSQKGEVTEAEIDTLILNAQKKLEKRVKAAPGQISKEALALLDDVEEELDRSFKDRVFEALKNGFVKVRSAVANRDQ
ncbi:hypothetical protein [Ascidiimonas aurantiaca]|uniref:hypothetical protein n=1 Tax=Ascidiimonas aurantiaca TaxID=1685432 RepID=UPI0030ECD708